MCSLSGTDEEKGKQIEMTSSDCAIGAAHSQQLRLLEENVERMDHCLSQKADAAHLVRIEAKVDRIGNMFWTLVTLIMANLIGIIFVLLRISL